MMYIWTAENILLLSFLLKGVCCRDFSISLPEKIDALSGSCVIIKCTFEIKEEYDTHLTDNATGCWHKDGTGSEKIVFNSSMSSQNSIIKGNITGTLCKKDCTTIFYDVRSNYSGTYYFRIEGEDGLKWNYVDKHVQIEVIESPPKPTVKLIEEQEVLEESSVSLRCSAESLCSSPPPTLTWSSTPRIPLSEIRQQELISDLNFTATHRHHRVTFTCTITYQLQDKNKTAQDNITLHVQYAPKISPSSSCNGSDVTVCFCEVDGNPSPELEWRLSGRPVTNSSNTFFSEERLNSTGLRSSITLHQSLTHTSTLECVGNNTHGTARKWLQLNLFLPDRGEHLFLISTGVAVGVSLTMMLSVIIYCARREKSRSSQTKQDDTTGIIMNDRAIQQEDESESVYANNAMLSPAEAATLNRQESLHYATIDFRNIKPESDEIRGISSLTTDYAVIHYSGEVAETKGSVADD